MKRVVAKLLRKNEAVTESVTGYGIVPISMLRFLADQREVVFDCPEKPEKAYVADFGEEP